MLHIVKLHPLFVLFDQGPFPEQAGTGFHMMQKFVPQRRADLLPHGCFICHIHDRAERSIVDTDLLPGRKHPSPRQLAKEEEYMSNVN